MQKTIFRATALSLLMTAAGFAFAASGALPVEKLAADVVVVGRAARAWRPRLLPPNTAPR